MTQDSDPVMLHRLANWNEYFIKRNPKEVYCLFVPHHELQFTKDGTPYTNDGHIHGAFDYYTLCYVCLSPIHVWAIKGTTWDDACSKECLDKIRINGEVTLESTRPFIEKWEKKLQEIRNETEQM